jgi:hypothetical protein
MSSNRISFISVLTQSPFSSLKIFLTQVRSVFFKQIANNLTQCKPSAARAILWAWGEIMLGRGKILQAEGKGAVI